MDNAVQPINDPEIFMVSDNQDNLDTSPQTVTLPPGADETAESNAIDRLNSGIFWVFSLGDF